MRRYQKWLSVGLIALTPGITLAGPLNSPVLKPGVPQAAAPPAQRAKGGSNQELANKIAGNLKKAKLSGFEIEISVQDGVATLTGMVSNKSQRDAAGKAAQVAGVKRINNLLRVGESPSKAAVQQAMMQQSQMSRGMARSQTIRPANFQAGYEGQEPIQQPTAPQPAPAPGIGPMAAPPAGIPAYGPPAAGASHVVYNQPNFPNYSWPTYAQYPNYAAVSYPSQYAASAWPYIGPFYPYPQVPLGWRKATLEWDDGYWNLNFRPRTDRWWWFLDPKNW